MRLSFLLFSASLCAPLTVKADGRCVDLSGSYRPPYETDADDVVTTVVYRQNECDSLSISGTALGKPHFESETKAYALQKFSLKGLPAPRGLDCIYNSYPGVCASYLATDNFVTKTVEKQDMRIQSDPIHGSCFYTVSSLSKDANGNLVEQPQASNCDDGFKGPVSPIIWPKVN